MEQREYLLQMVWASFLSEHNLEKQATLMEMVRAQFLYGDELEEPVILVRRFVALTHAITLLLAHLMKTGQPTVSMK